MKKVTLGFTVAMLMALLAAPLSATVMIPLSDADLTKASSAIVVGKCLEVQVERHGRKIVTRVTLEVQETLKGHTPAVVNVWVPGGIDASGPVAIGSMVPGAPTFLAGEDVFLFLQRPTGDKSGSDFGVLGLAQGKFSVLTDADGKSFVSRSFGGAVLPSGQRAVDNTKLDLESFKARILSLVEADR